jgi:hypothetical protein
MVSYDHLVLRTSDIVSCVKAGTLVDFLYWTQVYPAALSLANGCAPAHPPPVIYPITAPLPTFQSPLLTL